MVGVSKSDDGGNNHGQDINFGEWNRRLVWFVGFGNYVGDIFYFWNYVF